MSDKQFFNNLSATYADVRRLDAKKINLKGKNILEYINENKTIILDERGTNADDELDIWNSYVTEDEEGNIIVNRNTKPKEHTYEEMTDEQKELLLNNAVQVIDNQVLDTDGNHLMYWQTGGLTNGKRMFLDHPNLTTFTSDLSSLADGATMFYGCTNLTTFNSDLSSLTKGTSMFYECTNLTTFTTDLNSLTTAGSMFYGCTNLTTFNNDLSSLTEAMSMFGRCTNLTTFTSDLNSLTSGSNMFYGCTNLTTFTSDLSSLTFASSMFQECTSLSNFNKDLPKLTNGYQMFYNCSELNSFISNLENMSDGGHMFYDCSKLTSFLGDLSSLYVCKNMFHNCKLDSSSVDSIILSLPQRDAKPTDSEIGLGIGAITIGIGIPNTDEAKQAFAKECYYEDWADLNADFDDKNWVAQWQFNGEASTYDLRSPRPSTAVYAKLEEVIMPTDKNEHKPHYKYTSVDGSKFYNIHWYHESNMEDESYTLFDSLEAAIESYNVILKS